MENSIDNSNSKMEQPSVSRVSAGFYNVPSIIRSVISLFHFSGVDRQNVGIQLGSDGRGISDKRGQEIHSQEEIELRCTPVFTLLMHDFHSARRFSDWVMPEMTTWGSRLNFEWWIVPQVPATEIPMLLSREENAHVQVSPTAPEYLDSNHTRSFAIDTHARSLIRDSDDVYRPLPMDNETVLSKICSQLFMPFLDCDRLQNPDAIRSRDQLTRLLLPQ